MTENPQAGQPDTAPGDAIGDAVDPASTPGAEGSTELTGHPVVDEVLEIMRGLQDRPVDEHVAIFEAAHEKLRATLTDAGDRTNPAGS